MNSQDAGGFLLVGLGSTLIGELGEEGSRARTALAACLDEVLLGLGLPARVELRSFPDQPFELTVDAQPCPLPSKRLYGPRGAPSTTRRVVDGVVNQLDRLLPASVLERLLPSHDLGTSARARLDRVLRQVLGRGISCERALGRLPSTVISSDEVESNTLLELALATTKDLRTRVFVSPWSQRWMSGERASEMLEMMQDGLFYELGTNVPCVELVTDRNLPNDQVRFQLNDVLLAPLPAVHEGELLVNATPEVLERDLHVPARPCQNPANGDPAAIVAFQHGDACDQAGYTTWDACGFSVLGLSSTVRDHAAWLATPATVRMNLNLLEPAFPALVEVVRGRFTEGDLAEVFRRLLLERVNIRDLRGVLEAMLALRTLQPVDPTLGDLTAVPEWACPVPSREHGRTLPILEDYVVVVRRHLRNAISAASQVAPNDRTARVFELRASTIHRIRQGPADVLAPKMSISLADALDRSADDPSDNPVLLVPFDVRARIGEALARTHPFVRVVSRGELAPWLVVVPRGVLA